jgi:hypothetical protein
MTESDIQQREAPRESGDRRGKDRRRDDRRAPLPLWRRPWAYVGYGVAAGLLLVLLFRPEEPGSGTALEVSRTKAPPAVAAGRPAAAAAPVIDAYTVAEFEQLTARGEAAVGQRVRTVLFCEPTQGIALRNAVEVNRSVADLADAARRVPGAECKWGSGVDAPNLLLLIPPDLAERFASMPEVRQGFVNRRRVAAEVEWLGRQEALALRTAGVLRRLES